MCWLLTIISRICICILSHLTVNSRLADTSLLRTTHHCGQQPALQRNVQRNGWNKLPLVRTLAFKVMRTLSCSFPRVFPLFFLQKSWLTEYKATLRWRKIKKPFFNLGANMRISCLRPDLFPVRETTLETLCLCGYSSKWLKITNYQITNYFICLDTK